MCEGLQVSHSSSSRVIHIWCSWQACARCAHTTRSRVPREISHTHNTSARPSLMSRSTFSQSGRSLFEYWLAEASLS